MNSDEIHDRARQMVSQAHGEMTLSEAYSTLAKRRCHRKVYGVLHPMNSDARDFRAVETPRYAWQDRADVCG